MALRRYIIVYMLTWGCCAGALAQESLTGIRYSLFGKAIADSLIGHSSDQLSTTLTRVIDESQMNNRNQVTSVVDAIRGRVAGLQVSGNGTNALSAVRLRGTTSLTGGNDPLIMVDGVMGDLTLLQSIYPTDIESFTILKDASETAQFGSRGAAGVIDIKTKQGQAGKLHITYNGTFGVAVPFKRLEMLSADEYRAYTAAHGIAIVDKGGNSNFQKEIERTGTTHQHHLSFAGGNDHSSYRVSLGSKNEQKVIQGIGNRSFMGNMNVTQIMWNGLVRIDFGMFGSTHEEESIEDMQKLFYSAAAWNPTYPGHRNQQGQWDTYPSASQIKNPNALLDVQNRSTGDHLSTHAKFTFQLLPEVKLMLFGAYTYDSDELMLYKPTYVVNGGEAQRRTSRNERMMMNGMLNMNKRWKEHAVKLMLFTEVQNDKYRRFGVKVTSFGDDIVGYDALQAGAKRPWDGTTSYYESPRMSSFMGQAGYTYNDRYSVNATLRADGSSKFGDNNKWGYFPSLSVAWNLGKEKLLSEISFLDNLKLTAGLGWSGNQGAIDSYTTMKLLLPNGTPSVGQSLVTTYGELKNSNPDLKWEVSRTINIGVNSQLFNHRLVFSASYYYTKVTDMLFPYKVSVPPFKYPTLLANMGAMEKSGLELSLGATPLMTRDMQLTVNANLTFQRNKLLSLSGNYNGEELLAPSKVGIANMDGAGFHGNNGVVCQMIGQPLGVFSLRRFVGFTESEYNQGMLVYDYGDEYIAGQATPKVLLGSNLSFRYKNVDITMQINGAFGHKIFNGTSLSYMNLNSLPLYNVLAEAPERKIASQEITDYWLESGDYVNIDYITLGWQTKVKKLKIPESIRLSLTLNNVATITGYSGLTPMINSSSVNSTLGLDDKRTYPVYRTWTMGVSLIF